MYTIYNLSRFPEKQRYKYQSKDETISEVTRYVQSKIQKYCLNERFDVLYKFTIWFNSYCMMTSL